MREASSCGEEPSIPTETLRVLLDIYRIRLIEVTDSLCRVVLELQVY
jgi:hypothetical protein